MTAGSDARAAKAGSGAVGNTMSHVGVNLSPVGDEDRGRATLYGLLASALEAPVRDEWLSVVGSLEGGEGDVGVALGDVARLAREADPAALARDYHDLFIGVGRGELIPYGSFYLTGFLNEKPLARLRAEMRRLGIERDPEVKEPEDHIAAECQIMAGLVLGEFGGGARDEASSFFRDHLGSWAPYFFRDLAATSAGDLYPAIGRLGVAFMSVEADLEAMFDDVGAVRLP